MIQKLKKIIMMKNDKRIIDRKYCFKKLEIY